MPTGRLGAKDLSATTNTLVYTVPEDKIATVTINVCNRNASTIKTRVAFVDGVLVDLDVADYIEYDTEICSGGALERSGVAIAAGQSIIAYSDTANTSVQVWGFEEDI